MIEILVDADACPVKEEIYKVAFRRDTPVKLVANAPLRPPAHPLIDLILVGRDFDAADDWIVERAHAHAVVITTDILLAERALAKGASVLSPKGKAFTSDNIGGAIATRAIMADLRAGGEQLGGPAPMSKKDRSLFLQALENALAKLARS